LYTSRRGKKSGERKGGNGYYRVIQSELVRVRVEDVADHLDHHRNQSSCICCAESAQSRVEVGVEEDGGRT